MFKMPLIIFSLIAAVFLSCSCSSKALEYNTVVKIRIGQLYKQELKKAVEIPCFSAESRKRRKYEPESSAILGAYILSDDYCEGNIQKFEQMTSSHTFYTYNLKVGDAFPDQWVKNCIAADKIPFIVIVPDNDPKNLTSISQISKEIGKYHIKNFVSVYPDPAAAFESSAEYKDFFAASKRFFSVNSPETAFVWLCGESIEKNSDYFPENADWAGIYVYDRASYSSISENTAEFTKFYYKFQGKLPLMVFYGVSHYNSDYCRYYTPEAARRLSSVYYSLQNTYSCIKAVCISDFDGNISGRSSDNFLITDTDELLAAYILATSCEYFHGNIFDLSEFTIENIRKPYNIMKYNEKIYFPLKNYFENYNKYDIIYIDNEEYIPLP